MHRLVCTTRNLSICISRSQGTAAARNRCRFLSTMNPFHLAIPVHDLTAARQFYGEVMNLQEGRRDGDKWQDYNFCGHQLVCHFVGESYRCPDFYNPVDGDEVPVPHFGLAVDDDQFDKLVENFTAHKVNFIIPPHTRFEGMPGEQKTMFLKDPSGHNLEFKSMKNPENLFARYDVESSA